MVVGFWFVNSDWSVLVASLAELDVVVVLAIQQVHYPIFPYTPPKTLLLTQVKSKVSKLNNDPRL